ncbi:MAG: MFS transporter [Candidatus Thorarchaeota archaeon]|nr:MAG: MFS transporter [Candidatus Thorarchaeota archaeon]
MSTESTRLSYADKLRLINRDARFTIVSWMFYAFAFGINDVLFNLYLLEAGFGEDFLGFFLSISMFLTGGLALGAGLVADRYSRKKILLVSNTIIFVGFFIQYSTLTPLFLLISQLLYGIGYGFNGVCWQPYTTSVTTEEERVHVFSLRFAFFLVASLLGSLAGGFLPSLFSGLGLAINLLSAYRLSLWIALIPIGLSVLSIIPMKTDRVVKKRRFGFSNVIHRKFIGKYALAWTVSGLGAGLFINFFNVFFNLAFAADEVTIGIIFAINTLVMAIGNFTSPTIVDRFGKLGTIIWFQIFSLPFLFLLSWSPVLYIGAIGYISRALFINIAWPVMDVFYMEGLENDEQATAMGVINTGDSLGRAIGLNIGGMLLASGLLRVPYFLAGILYAASIILFIVFFGGKTEDSEKKTRVVRDE